MKPAKPTSRTPRPNSNCTPRVTVTFERSWSEALARANDIGSGVETSTEKRNRLIVEGKVAMAEHAARVAAVDKNTQRLRALRLAKEAADREAALLNPPPEKAKRKASSR